MMTLTTLLEGLVRVSENDLIKIKPLAVSGLALDSRKVASGDVFVALSGSKQHGLTHVDQAITQGAVGVLFEPSEMGYQLADKVTQIPTIEVKNLAVELGKIAARFYGFPSQHLDVIGITGTNGKTSCSQFLGQALANCGIIGTLGWGNWGQLNLSINTTPDALTIQQILADFVAGKKQSVAMEVSSHGLDQGRVNGVNFKGAVFTNISREHLDYHHTMESYLAAKLKLLQAPGLNFVVVNLDDSSCDEVIAAVPATAKIWSISSKGKTLNSNRSITAENIQHTAEGIEFNILWNGDSQPIKAALFGDFNAENLLCVVAVMLALDHKLTDIAAKIATIKPVTGRMERCETDSRDVQVFVDYAHTPDALQRALASLRKHCLGALWVVFGCGGNRDAGKRPQMGSIAEEWADVVIVTDDNPRFEESQAIANEILSGCRTDKVMLIPDRTRAIEHAIINATRNDCVVIAGKGHETYQEINGVQQPFNDRKIAEEALQKRYGLQ